jgi:hypothetical protein
LEIPTQLLLSKIEGSCLYLDKQSLEEYTGIRKPKYKLARSKILEQYLFHVLTKNKGTCKKILTLSIKREDWLDRIPGDGYLKEKCSYCDISKHVLHSEKSLINKIKYKKNGFPYVAKLSPNKYLKLLKLCKKSEKIPTISESTKEIIKLSLDNMLDDKLKGLGLD